MEGLNVLLFCQFLDQVNQSLYAHQLTNYLVSRSILVDLLYFGNFLQLDMYFPTFSGMQEFWTSDSDEDNNNSQSLNSYCETLKLRMNAESSRIQKKNF